MVVISDSNYLSDKDGTILGAIIGVSAICLLFFLYVRNRNWWTTSVSTMAITCCDDACPPISSKSTKNNSLVENSASVSFYHPEDTLVSTCSYEGNDTSSESEVPTSRKNSELLQVEGVRIQPLYLPSRHDIVSMVERGRVGMSSNSSCCSSTTSSVGEKQTVISVSKIADVREVAKRYDVPEIEETKPDSHGSIYPINLTHKQNIELNRDCIVVMNPDNEDETVCSNNSTISCLLKEDHNLTCGHLEVSLAYEAPARKLTVCILQACNIPSRDKGLTTQTQVRILLLPSKKQKHKTKVRSGENPQYREQFLFLKVNPEDVNSMGIRLRLYGCEKMRRERLLGEAVIRFASINLEVENNFWITLQPRVSTELSRHTSRSDSIGSASSVQHGNAPELLMGLCYNAITGRLNVEVIKGSNFRNHALNQKPDSYVKLSLVSSTGQELAHSKTTVRRGQPNPLFKETFIFQVALFQLADVTLMIAVYNRKGVTKKKEMIGWFSLGLNSSGAENAIAMPVRTTSFGHTIVMHAIKSTWSYTFPQKNKKWENWT